MKAFITATGTDIGKTYVACGLLRQWRAEGHPTRALKPICTGFDPDDAAGSDPALLLSAQDQAVDLSAIAAIAPWRFTAPLSPDWAAALERRDIDYAVLLAFCRAGLATQGAVLIEGIGGVMVPLDATHTVLDLATDLALPVVLVAGSYLGTLSHTLTALAVLRQRGLRCVVVISPTPISGAAGSPPDATRTADIIGRHGDVPVIILARTAPHQHDAGFARLAQAVSSDLSSFSSDCPR